MDNLNEKYKSTLLKAIPAVESMALDIESISDDSITLSAPLSANINYEGTAFGGSLNTSCILSCYLLIHHKLVSKNINFSSLVIQDSSIKYLKPVHSNFLITSSITTSNWEKLLRSFHTKGKGRIEAFANVSLKSSNAKDLVLFSGRFIVS